MKHDPKFFAENCPDVPPELITEHLGRLDERYFDNFSWREVCRHLQALAKLSHENPVELLLTISIDRTVECTVLSFDYRSVFSIITGILAEHHMSIQSGEIFTYARAEPGGPRRPSRRARTRRMPAEDPLRRRRIIDRFSGTLEGNVSFEKWAFEVKNDMVEMISLLESGSEEAMLSARRRVNELVAERLAEIDVEIKPVLYPVQIEIDNSRPVGTRLKVVSEDTPAFLYALSNALALLGISIEGVTIRTDNRRIEDEIYISDAAGRQIIDPDKIDQIKFSVLLTKQFTYFLGRAPDPYRALERFDLMVEDILKLPEQGKWFDLLSNPEILKDLARLLGASDYIWEDFIRLQYETLLPILTPQVKDRDFSDTTESLERRLDEKLRGANTPEERRVRLNEFKDNEIFLLDLDHILNPRMDFRLLSEKLTRLAEVVVMRAIRFALEELVRRFGTPKTVAGLDAKYAVLGLGKLGGVALGYASDIELLFVYSDSGRTDGAEPLENSVFFDRLVRDAVGYIDARREGIFHIDLRLRPYGKDGPNACSLETFCMYYGKGGPAHSYEKLALVRLRAIGGDAELAEKIERLRDEMLYGTKNIDIDELRKLREKQFREKNVPGRQNAKFSPGALVDLEYDIQILQVMHARGHAGLQTPRIHEALNGLTGAGVISQNEAHRLCDAYEFFRKLINALRMLRGSARDLFLPPVGSDEYVHLARRMGYRRDASLKPEQQLHLDFETTTATIRTFVENHFGRGTLPGPEIGNVADLVLSEQVSRELRTEVLAAAGFVETERAYVNLKNLAGDSSRREMFARLAVLACDTLVRTPDADMALNNWERFVAVLKNPRTHFEMMLSQPMRLEILLRIFSVSQFLADTLVRNPEFLDWITIPENLHRARNVEDLRDELDAMSFAVPETADWLDRMRRFRRREILRIGTRDMCLKLAVETVTHDLAMLAEAIVQSSLNRIWQDLRADGRYPENGNPEKRFAILAFGKLGGRELNYSSDIDLLGVIDDASDADEFYSAVMEKLSKHLSAHTQEGYAYRVDLRLRPYGRSGRLVLGVGELADYYRGRAALWELQALIKARPIAGNLRMGQSFLAGLRPLLVQKFDRAAITANIEKLRTAAIKKNASHQNIDIKTGLGGIRDIEFLVQGLQLINAAEKPGIIEGNTLAALDRLAAEKILPAPETDELRENYIFLRRLEHYLQILEDRQIHALPSGKNELRALARRMLGGEADADALQQKLDECRNAVRRAYARRLLDAT